MNLKILCIITGGLLLLAILPIWPYEFYILLRWLIFISSIIIAFDFYLYRYREMVITFGVVAVLFNPILPFHLDRTVWVIFDFIGAIIFFSSTYFKTEKELEKISLNNDKILVSLTYISNDIYKYNFIKQKLLFDEMYKSYLKNEPVYVPKTIFNEYGVSVLPDKLVVNGDLLLDRCYHLKQLPKIMLSVNGNLKLPDGIILPNAKIDVKGVLNIWDYDNPKLPNNIKIGGLETNYLHKLPSINSINGPTYIGYNSSLIKFPESLKLINGDLKVGSNYLQYLNDDITVNGQLYVGQSPNLKRLGKKIRVKDDLWLDGEDTGIIEICDSLECNTLVFNKFKNHLKLPQILNAKEVLLRDCPNDFIEYITKELKHKKYHINPNWADDKYEIHFEKG